jgi:PAS domain S-box-containing protein
MKQETVEESELYNLLESAGDAAFVVDQQGLIRYWSRKAEDLLGFRKEQVVTKNCADVLAGCDEAGAPVCCRDCRVLETARKSGAVAAYDLKVATASGGHKWLNISIVLARTNRGRTPLVVHLMRGIDERKRIEMVTKDILVSVGRLTGHQADRLLQRGRPESPAFGLTSREKTILKALALGRNPGAIAAQLHISRTTVRNHIQHILAKLQCHSRLEAVMRATREGLI